MKTATTLFFSLCLAISSIIAQTEIEGTVFDSTSGEPLLFATVTLYKGDVLIAGLETDLDGHYIITDIDPGTYDMEASYIGYTPHRYTGVIIKAGRTNRLDFGMSEGVLMDEVHIVAYKVPLLDTDYTRSSATMTAEYIRSLPTKSVSDMTASVSGMSTSSDGGISMRSTRSDATVYYIDGVRTTGSLADKAEPLPKSGQMTAGEWNDLHNWKDWMTLLEDETYSIMTERFEIFPLERYSVVVVNEENNVIPNVEVQLLDKNGAALWTAYSDNAGKAELWLNAFEKGEIAHSIAADGQKVTDIKTIDEGSNTLRLSTDCATADRMDIVFAVDGTSSMSDEILYLKSELLDVISRIRETNEDIDYRVGSVFYRDHRDEYLTRTSPLSSDESQLIEFVKAQYASGGGDYPEAVDAALEETLAFDWRPDALKIAFLILDAPPHEDEETMARIRRQIAEASQKGIKLIPITASGIGRETEFLMKFMAMMTNGTYVFITDHSGIGNAHLDPVVEDYEVEKLNDCIVRLINLYGESYSCAADVRSNDNIDINIYPNPSTQYINITMDVVPDKIKVRSANGMVVKTVVPTEKSTRVELDDLVNGVYTVSIQVDDRVESRQVILLK